MKPPPKIVSLTKVKRPKRHKGISYYTTSDGVKVARLHYSADPEKDPATPDGALWLEATSSGWTGGILGADWRQEFELDFEIEAGTKIWNQFDTTHYPFVTYNPRAEDAPKIEKHWPIWVGMDWGTVNKTVFTVHAMQSPRRVYQFDELVFEGKGDLTPAYCAEKLREKWYFEHVDGWVGDPVIWRRYPSDRPAPAGARIMTSIGKMFQAEGIYIQSGSNHEGVDSDFITLLNGSLWANKDAPVWMISRDCKETIDNFRTVQWLEKSDTAIKNSDAPEKIRSKGVDAFDSAKYFCMSVSFEAPEQIEAPFGTWAYYEEKMLEEIEQSANVFG